MLLLFLLAAGGRAAVPGLQVCCQSAALGGQSGAIRLLLLLQVIGAGEMGEN